MEEPGCRRNLTPLMEDTVAEIRTTLSGISDPSESAHAVAEVIAHVVGRKNLLTEAQRKPNSEGEYTQHVLHVEEDGSFSVVSLVWLSGQDTPIHDHVSWCVPAVHEGREEEIHYQLTDGAETGRQLLPVGTQINEQGDVTALTPPGDIHRVRNPGPGKAVSIHVYGADISQLGSSIRRTYDLAVRSDQSEAATP